MRLSVVIPCLNAADTIGFQLEALANQDWAEPWEVIVSDNGSTDKSRAIVESYLGRLPHLRLVDSSDRQGAAHARNVGVLASESESVLFTDADDEVAENYVAVMGEALRKYDFVACAFDTVTLNERWQSESWANSQESDLIEFNPRFLPFGGGGSLGVKRRLHLAVGGFDTSISFRTGMEDADYCWRIQLAGTELKFVPETAIRYRYPKEYLAMYRQMRNLSQGAIRLYKRFRPLGMPEMRVSWKAELVGLKGLLLKLPRVRGKVNYAKWVRRFGWQVGRLRGSFKYRHQLSEPVQVQSDLPSWFGTSK